eukprot:scaffold308612_cov17-Prasinocladus_malaysianus.AAC.1
MADRALTHYLFVCPYLRPLLLDGPQALVEVSINTFDNRMKVAMKYASDMIVVIRLRGQACKRREVITAFPR